jgi:hypothetical protein
MPGDAGAHGSGDATTTERPTAPFSAAVVRIATK